MINLLYFVSCSQVTQNTKKKKKKRKTEFAAKIINIINYSRQVEK